MDGSVSLNGESQDGIKWGNLKEYLRGMPGPGSRSGWVEEQGREGV